MTNPIDDLHPLQNRDDDDDTGSGDRPKTAGLGVRKKAIVEAGVQEAASDGDDTGGKTKPKVGLGPRRD